MDRRQIHRNIGKIVAYINRDGDVIPAKILDSRLWKHHKGPEENVEVSDRSRVVSYGGVTVGYPVLMPKSGFRRDPEERRNMERWLRSTAVTMSDLFDEQGDRREPARWSEIEGTIFRVVFPASLREDYPGLRKAHAAEKRAQQAQLKLLHDGFEVVEEAAVEISNKLGKLGFISPDGLPIVTTQQVGSDRLSLPLAALDELVRVALPMLNGCDICGAHDYLLPHDVEHNGTLLLCATCHPRVS